MENIIVPTDFSSNASNALQYAINLANHFGSTIHLLHVYEVRSRTGMMVSIRDFMKDDAEQGLSKQLQSYKDHLLHGTAIVAKAIEGVSMDTIVRYSKAKQADLIIMGTQGASGLKEIFFGSNTVALIKKVDCPVLAIPSAYTYQPIKKITFPVDSEIVNTAKVVEPLVNLAKAYKAKIDVLHIKDSQEYALIDPGIDIYLSDIKHDFHVVNDNDINQAINAFVQQSNPQMLCMIRRKRSILGELFHTSVTKKEAFHSPVPLLILSA